jgi:hypothetical protein
MHAGTASRRVLGNLQFHHALLEVGQQPVGLGQREADFLGAGRSGRPGQGGQLPALHLAGARPDLQAEGPLESLSFRSSGLMILRGIKVNTPSFFTVPIEVLNGERRSTLPELACRTKQTPRRTAA